MKLAVVILNWNGRKMLEKFLPSVTQHTLSPAEVIVADNGSTDDSLEFLRQNYPDIRVIALDKNYGFAEGYNKALAQVDAEYFVLLNDDVEVESSWWEPVVHMMDEDKSIAIAQPKLLMYDQRDTFEYAGGAGGFIDAKGYPFCRGRIFSTVEKDHGQYDNPCEIFWASGAAMFVRASVWKELGGLDGDFFAHMEEIDFCWRAKNRNYKVMYCPLSKVYHVGGGTLPKSSPMKTLLNFRNNLSMLHKNLPDDCQKKVLRQRKILDRIAALKFLIGGSKAEYQAVGKAHREYNERKADLERKRVEIAPREVDCIYPKSILVDYYLRGRKKFSDLHWRQ